MSHNNNQTKNRLLKISILRYNPADPASVPHMQTFELEESASMTLFIALNELRDKQDPSLQFDFVCRAGICGSCAMMINGKGEYIALVGDAAGDPSKVGQLGSDNPTYQNFDGYKILLTHNPAYYDDYAAAGFDLVLSGHTHGGQIRLPFIGAVYCPDQGFFPEYDSGVITKGDTTIVISRGIGNSRVPIRFLCRPEVVVIELQHG